MSKKKPKKRGRPRTRAKMPRGSSLVVVDQFDQEINGQIRPCVKVRCKKCHTVSVMRRDRAKKRMDCGCLRQSRREINRKSKERKAKRIVATTENRSADQKAPRTLPGRPKKERAWDTDRLAIVRYSTIKRNRKHYVKFECYNCGREREIRVDVIDSRNDAGLPACPCWNQPHVEKIERNKPKDRNYLPEYDPLPEESQAN